MTGYDPSVRDETSARRALDEAFRSETERQRLRAEHAAGEVANNVDVGNTARSRRLRRSSRRVPQRSGRGGHEAVVQDSGSESEYVGSEPGQAGRRHAVPQRGTRASRADGDSASEDVPVQGSQDDDGDPSPLTPLSHPRFQDVPGYREDDDSGSEGSNIVVAHTFPAGRTQGLQSGGDRDEADEADGGHESDNDSELSELSDSQVAELERVHGMAGDAAGQGPQNAAENAEDGPRLPSGGEQGLNEDGGSGEDVVMQEIERADNNASIPQQGPSGEAQDDDSDDGDLDMPSFWDELERARGEEEIDNVLDRQVRRTVNGMIRSGRIARGRFTLPAADAPAAPRPSQAPVPAAAPDLSAAEDIRDSVSSLLRDDGMPRDGPRGAGTPIARHSWDYPAGGPRVADVNVRRPRLAPLHPPGTRLLTIARNSRRARAATGSDSEDEEEDEEEQEGEEEDEEEDEDEESSEQGEEE